MYATCAKTTHTALMRQRSVGLIYNTYNTIPYIQCNTIQSKNTIQCQAKYTYYTLTPYPPQCVSRMVHALSDKIFADVVNWLVILSKNNKVTLRSMATDVALAMLLVWMVVFICRINLEMRLSMP